MWYKHRKKRKKFPLNLQLQTIQILTNDVQTLILSFSHFISTVKKNEENSLVSVNFLANISHIVELATFYNFFDVKAHYLAHLHFKCDTKNCNIAKSSKNCVYASQSEDFVHRLRFFECATKFEKNTKYIDLKVFVPERAECPNWWGRRLGDFDPRTKVFVQLEQLPTEWHCQRCEPFPQWFPNLEIKIGQEIEYFAALKCVFLRYLNYGILKADGRV